MGTIHLPIPYIDHHRAGHPPAFAYGQPEVCMFCVADADAKVRREVSEGSAAANASSPSTGLDPGPPAECPNCLTDLDETGFCSMCGRVETSA